MLIVFYTYLVIEYVRPQYWLPFLGYIRPALFATVILFIFSIRNFQNKAYQDKGLRAAIVFLGLCAFSISYSVNTFWAFQTSTVMAAHIFAFMIPLGILITNQYQWTKLILFWVAIHSYVAIFAITHGGTGPGNFISDENDVALVLNVGIAFAFILRSAESLTSRTRFLLTLATVVMVVGVVSTFSRGGFVGLASTGMALIYFSKRRLRNLAIVAVLAVAAYQVAPDEYVAEMGTITNTEQGTASGRLYQWGIGWDIYVDNPIFGVGAGNYPWRVAEYELSSGKIAPNQQLHGGRAAHSLYFTLLPELGTVGTVCFVVAFLGALGNLRRTIVRESNLSGPNSVSLLEASARATIVGFFGFLATGTFISVLYYPTFWHLVAISFILNSLSMRAAEEPG